VERDRGAFKTPGLRDVSRHAPYMHDGSLATLRDVVEFYNKGGVRNPNLSARVRPLGLTPQEVDALVAFLRALDGEGYQDQPPKSFPR
jgi:cytochrome c peroxidase